jgi:purine-nucleoside phosphorylase
MDTTLDKAVQFIQQRWGHTPDAAIVLGSGLGVMADSIEDPCEIPYARIPGFLASTVPGHAGKLILGKLGKKQCVLMNGRFHFYEGYSQKDIVFPVRLFKRLGTRSLVLTNACGGINLSFSAGDLMLIQDHINLSGSNPLVGHNDDELGPRFPDMSYAYSRKLQQQMRAAASRCNIPLREGVYAMMLGPSFETPAEIRMLRTIGADVVGMSTVPEVIAAAHCALETVAVSCVTNLAAGVLDKPLSHEEVLEAGLAASEKFRQLLLAFVEGLH